MKKMDARETLLYLAELLTAYLEELRSAAKGGFAYGEKTAYTECLEIVQAREEAAVTGWESKTENRNPQSTAVRSPGKGSGGGEQSPPP